MFKKSLLLIIITLNLISCSSQENSPKADQKNSPEEVKAILEDRYEEFPDDQEHFTLYDYFEMSFIDLDKEYDLDKEFESKWCISYRWDNVVYEEKYAADNVVEPRMLWGPKSGVFFIKIEDGDKVVENYSRTQIQYGVNILDEYLENFIFYGFGSCDWARGYDNGVEMGDNNGTNGDVLNIPEDMKVILGDRYKEFPDNQEHFRLYDYFEMPFIDLDKEYNLDEEYESKWCISYRWDNVVYEEKYADSEIEPQRVWGQKSGVFFIKIQEGEMVVETYARAQILYGVNILDEYLQNFIFYGLGSCDWAREYEKDLEKEKFK